ncbi:PTS sugar transporter subunit IIA [Salinibacterium sp. NSLL150]|uniref:PTS sugar transporter subunit IIA n=1 Tax=unclassified Salinibacterium TaxID=2632331 RepID=UPI0018CE8030|nr:MULTISPECIES: PTS sugar transporter subunit IIA [unclassified Salinibacterium]MBH0024836.1 PTS sugar transporter subunit IIA [Salinibacterium sp. SWN248]MBH0099743.1 PTS sugar transporter subunit IIA [Salinibacterium sp. NSLL35]MBH0102497.1 PTS sugar transporter subunit IIA [Salinibacterium sp. NSLL150]MBH0105257.1 PTS sugar transporter subunit IIA [Salinibacterium sp. NSLL16]MBH0108017.1 PTS sugar transporter subunit IIA [Salinibacterium sp. NSLL17]
MSLPPLPESAIEIDAFAVDWRAAVRLSGEALVRSGAAKPGYADEMIRMIEDHGPYVVIAPGLALAHARPGPQVIANGLSVVTLKEPVRFGHAHNDPVRVVLGLAISEAGAHLAAVAAVANIFNDSSAINELAAATSAAEVQRIMGVNPS